MGVLSLLDNENPVINGKILIIQELLKVFSSLPVTQLGLNQVLAVILHVPAAGRSQFSA